MLFMPCRHELFCSDCSKLLNDAPMEGFKLLPNCPLCDTRYDDIVRIYKLEKFEDRNKI